MMTPAIDQPMELAVAIEAGEVEEVEMFFEEYYDEKTSKDRSESGKVIPEPRP